MYVVYIRIYVCMYTHAIYMSMYTCMCLVYITLLFIIYFKNHKNTKITVFCLLIPYAVLLATSTWNVFACFYHQKFDILVQLNAYSRMLSCITES
jgi:hypothetical protein